jgi:flagellar basal body-associated protein FliL
MADKKQAGGGEKKKKMKKTSKILLGITMSILLVVVFCIVPISSASTGTQTADFTEGGHLETDFNVLTTAQQPSILLRPTFHKSLLVIT